MQPATAASLPADRFISMLRALRPGSDQERALRLFFGEERVLRLLRLAHRRRARATRPRPLLILVPGLMASHLAVTRHGRRGIVWIDVLRLLRGDMDLLALAPDGVSESDPGRTVLPAGVDRRVTADAVVALGDRYEVREFAYDWRRPIAQAADELAAAIMHHRRQGRVHLLAHSMGGLVCRLLLHRHPRVRERIGGRIIAAGTPHRGSYAAVPALTGEEETLRLLAMLDLRHSREHLRSIVAGFPSCYQLLPHADVVPASCRCLYRGEGWGDTPVRRRHLRAAVRLQRLLAARAADDGRLLFCVAGIGVETITALEVKQEGGFRYLRSAEGDGTVPAAHAVLEGAPGMAVHTHHAGLLMNEEVLESVAEILVGGGRANAAAAVAFPAVPHELRLRRRDPAAVHREEEFAACLDRVRSGGKPEADIARAGNLLCDAARGAPGDAVSSGPRRSRAPVRVDIIHADVTAVRTPLLVVGHYTGVPPVRAIGALDRALQYRLSAAFARAALPGAFGQLTFLPVRRGGLAAETILVAGMGDEGSLTAHDLRALAARILLTAGEFGYRECATVLLGSGQLGLERALRGLLEGAAEARESSARAPGVIRIVECEGTRARALRGVLAMLEEEGRAVAMRVRRRPPPRTHSRPAQVPPGFGVRIAVLRTGTGLRFSLMTGSATIPERGVEVQRRVEERLRAELLLPGGGTGRRAARLLGRMLVPDDFRPEFRPQKPLTFIVDAATSDVPWEMLEIPGRLRGPLGLAVPVVRQLRMEASPVPAAAARPHEALHVLVIADPADGEGLRLPGAAEEGRMVADLLRRAGRAAAMPIRVTERIGPHQCDVPEMLSLLLEGAFDCVHFAGHAIAPGTRPSAGGWILGTGKGGRAVTLSARELFRARRPPRMVFANACLTGRLPGLAEAFLAAGVAHYIGAAWRIADADARQCAVAFYAALLRRGTTIAAALLAGRRAVRGVPASWGAYHHYGNSTDTW
jgi:pimeloyl-ACP methyl ester carboxylesterase